LRSTTLGDICEFKYGKSLPASLREAGQANVYGSNGRVGTHVEALLEGPAIVIGRKGSFGEVHFSDGPLWPIDTTYYIDREAADCDLKWLVYLLRFLPLKTLNKSAAIPGLNREDAYRLSVDVPPLEEQRRIAAILDKADALRRRRKRSLDLFDTLSQSILLEMFGSLARHRMTTLSDALSEPLRNGLSPAKAGTFPGRVLTLSSITGKIFKPSAAKDAMFEYEPPARQRVEKGQFLICRGNGNKSLVGIGVFAPASMKETAFPDTMIAGRVDNTKFDFHYFQDVWNSALVREQIEKSARTTNGTFKVNQHTLDAIEIPAPSLDLQIAYGTRVSSIKGQAAQSEDQLSHFESLFSSLQSRAFSGQL